MEVKNKVYIDKENPCIQRIDERCIDCGMCLNTCKEVTDVDRENERFKEFCLYCGKCVLSCPMGALKEQYHYKKVLNLVKDSKSVIAISIAPAVRVALAEELFKQTGKNMENMIPAILKKIGFSYVFDVTFGADVTIMEEASELINRIKNGGGLPMFTSCCPSWIKYVDLLHPELKKQISSTKSPISIMSSLIKTYFKEMNDISDNIISVVVAPCTAKKWEALNNDTDYVITTRELALMIRECSIDVEALKPCPFDSMLGYGSKCGLEFGQSGGVMEASLSTVYYFLTGKIPEPRRFHIEGRGVREASFKIGENIIHVAVVDGIKNIENILTRLDDFDFIEVMNCAGGCIGGGGQPITSKNEEKKKLEARYNTIINADKEIFYPFENKLIKDMYQSYLNRPLSEKALNILHD